MEAVGAVWGTACSEAAAAAIGDSFHIFSQATAPIH